MVTKEETENAFPLTESVDLMELFPKMLNVDRKNFKVSPSEYIREMSLTLEERHKKLIHTSSTSKIIDDEYPPECKVFPHMLVFQRFEGRETYSLTLEVKNIGKNLLPLSMHCPSSEFFSARCVGSFMNKIAPGLSVEYEIIFTPNEAKDYSHYVSFKCKAHTFQVPIIAIGPRAILDIPDKIILNSAGVKIPTSKFIVIRNIGNAPAVFSFITENNHFQISPQKGILPIYDTLLLNISFCSFKVGEVKEIVYLMLETGEKLVITLVGSAETLPVRLDKSTVVHEDTYLGLKRCKTVHLTNNGSNVIKFSWKKHKSVKEELALIQSLKEKYTELAELEVRKDAKVVYFGVSNNQQHKLSCERILNDEVKIFQEEEFKFSHPNFSIIPEAGEVWPKSTVEILTSFEPKSTGNVFAEAYLEVTGRESRLPLRLKGCGAGPNIVLNVKTLDIDYIYLCSFHRYEVLAENKGNIDGTIEHKPEPLLFGGKVEVSPESRHLKPKEFAAFIISFTSNRQGEFTETISFVIKESGDKVDFVLKGRIVCPTLHFDIKRVDFGVIPFGFPTTREVTLSNLSVVPVTFSLRVLADGQVPSISYEEFAKFPVKPSLIQSPKEFHIEPEESLVEPFSSKKVTVTLTANRAGLFFTNLVVDMWDSDTGSLFCPIHFYPQVPNLTSDPEKIIIPFCFVNFPYTRSITIKNHSKVDGFFYILPSDPNVESTACSASVPQGVVEARSSVTVDITLITSALGRQVIPIRLLTFGLESPREVCLISFIGQGPVLSLNHNSMNWGELALLEESTKTLTISNESPIPAYVTIALNSPPSPWSVHPLNFTILPEKTIDVAISLTLYDQGKYKDLLKIAVHNGKTQQVHLSAIGVGSSLTMTPIISPNYNLGTLYSCKKYEFEIQIANKGTKPYSLLWSPLPDYRSFLNDKFGQLAEATFNIKPYKIDVHSKDTKTVILEVYGKSVGDCQQTFYCFSSSGNPTKELFITSDVFAQFVEPLINIDKEEVLYWYNVGPTGVDSKLHDTVTITNFSVLPIKVVLEVNHPFSFQITDEESTYNYEMILEAYESSEIKIKFGAQPHPGKRSKSYKDVLSVIVSDHSRKLFVSLKGEVNYPNLVIFPRQIDFQNIPLGGTAYSEACLVNLSPLTAYYEISWNVISSEMMYYEGSQIPFESVVPKIEPKEKLKEFDGEHFNEEVESSNENAPDEYLKTGTSQVSMRPEFPTLKMPEITIPKSAVKEALFPLSRNFYVCEEELLNAYKMTRSSDIEDAQKLPAYIKLCDITPFYGKLDPYASQILSIKFSGNYPIHAHLEALIEVNSGPTEIIKIDARTGEIDFRLSGRELDFEKQLFCETKSHILTLENTGVIPFCFEAYNRNSQVCQLNDDFLLGMSALTVTPRSGNVDSYSTMNLTVRYHPGVPGRFEDSFQLQIAYLDPVAIKVKGFGVFPQVHLFLPRPELHVISPETGYLAVASLTPDWILTGYVTSSELCDSYITKPYRSRESGLDTLHEEKIEDEDWEFIHYSEGVPSNIDISLAVERILALNLVSENSTNSTTFAVYARTIPQFRVPAYELDFGVCEVGRMVKQNVSVQNFGPLPVIMYIIFEPRLQQDGILIRLKNRNELKIGGCITFTVGFLPKKKRFKKKIQNLETFFYFEVYHGPKIPVKINTIVTYPHVITSMCFMDFCQVICGRCKIMPLKLKNPGLVTANWSLHFRKKTGDFYENSAEEKIDGRHMFHSSCTSGSLIPNEDCCIHISFQPKFEGLFSATLVIHVAQGLEEIKVLLLGEAFESKLTLSQYCLDFGSTLPFPNKLEKTFVVTNSCEFPIEFYFPTIDDQIYEEDKILRAVMLYYQTKEILLPIRCPGDSLPQELISFYRMLLEDMKKKYIEEEREKALAGRENQYVNTLVLSGEDDSENAADASGKTIKKIGRSFSRSQTSLDVEKGNDVAFESNREFADQSVFDTKTALEIDRMLQEYILNILHKEPSFDPLQDALKNVLPQVEEEEYSQGTLIIFHGAPFTNYMQSADKFALSAGLTPLNIDQIILEEATLGRCEAGITARDLIEQAYWDLTRDKKDQEETFEEEENKKMDTPKKAFIKDFEEIQGKFNTLIEIREIFTNKNKNPVTASAKSDPSRKQDQDTPKMRNLNDPFATFSDDLIIEILKFRFSLEVRNGLIMEGLLSSLVKPSTKALEIVLKAAGNLRDIIVIFLLSNYDQYKEFLRNKQAEEELAKVNFRKELLRIFEEEPQEIFDGLNLDSEYAKSIRAEYLSQRKESHEVFVVQKTKFYEMKKLTTEDKKKIILFKKHSEPPDTSEKKGKEKKVESGKGNKISDISGRKTGSETRSAKSRKDSEELVFLEFESEFEEMKKLIEVWDQRKGAPVQVDATPETKLKKGQTARKSEPPAFNRSNENNSGRGVFLWLVDVSNQQKNLLSGICCLLKSILRTPVPLESDAWPLQHAESATFAVVPYPPTRTRTCEGDPFTVAACENCTLEGEDTFNEVGDSGPFSSTEKLDRSQSSISFKTKRKTSAISKRRKPESRMSIDVKSHKSKNLSLEAENLCKARCILQPGEKASYRVRFFPTQTGIWQQTIPINLVTWVNGTSVHCVGVCDIPKLDMTPEVIFPPTFGLLVSSENFSYTNSEKIYDFGAVIQPNEEKKSSEKKTIFTLSNPTTLPVDLNVVFVQDAFGGDLGGSPQIKFTPNKFLLNPREKEEMTVIANPTKTGSVKEFLMFLVKNNPKVEVITLKCEGVKPDITVEPETVNFDRMLLHRKESRPITFKNHNTVPLYILLNEIEDFPQQLTFSETRGWINPLKTLTVYIEYNATEVQVIQQQTVEVKVFDAEDAEESVQEFFFNINAEAYDAAVDIIFSRKEDDHVNFGDIRVENECTYVFNLKNQGKYPLGFSIDINHQILAESQNDNFLVNPTHGIIPPGKNFPLTVSFMARNEVSWKRMPLLKLVLTEPYNGDELIATIPICVSATSHFAKYEIKPEDHFNLGHIPVGQLREGSLLIINEGHFSISYFIETLTTFNTAGVSEDAFKKSSKHTPSSKEKGDKAKKIPSVCKVGIFEISPTSGIAEKGQTAVVNIKCHPEEEMSYEEKIVIFVNESLPHLKQGSLITISAESCLPAIQFGDAKSVFREHFVCKTEAEFNNRIKVGSYTIFTENNNTLSFKNVCVNKTAEARIYLPNASVIECHVVPSIVPPIRDEHSKTTVTSNGSQCFHVPENKIIIEPYNFGLLLIAFRPEGLEEYKARLIITLEMPDNFDNIIQTYELRGNGVLPQIEITKPTSKVSDGQTLLTFSPVAPGNYSTSVMAFTNIGTLECKVILELYKFQNGIFKLLPKSETKKMMKIWDLVKPIDHTTIISILPGEIAEFEVIFSPKELISYQSLIKLLIVDNPFENWSFKLLGEVTAEEVVIERVRKSTPFLEEDEKENRSSSSCPNSQNSVNFGDCSVKKRSRALLRLTNKTEKDYFRFEWENFPNITISPSAGHLYPHSYKEVLVIFQPEEPIELEDVPIACTLSKILLESPSEPSWDTRLTQFQMHFKADELSPSQITDKEISFPLIIPESGKINGEEPVYEVVPEFNKTLFLTVSGVADYAKLHCETTKINFKNTFMFQNRVFALPLENTGNVSLRYTLKLKSVTVSPLKTEKMCQITEMSLSKLRLEKTRPKSSGRFFPSCRSTSDCQPLSARSTYDKRPRPLTSVSLLDLKKIPESEHPESMDATSEVQNMVNYNPFAIENVTGQIRSKEKIFCNIIFSPMDINEYKAVIGIEVPNLHPDYVLPEIEVSASSIMPYCHFNVPESDYLDSGRRDHSRPGPIGYAPGMPLDADTKTIEIKVYGIGSTIPIKFHVINPTEEDYTFSWLNVTPVQQETISSFHCSTLDGCIRAGRQQQMVFSFISQKIGIVESFWKFCIPKYEVEMPFLFVGDVREASVYFLPNHIILKPTIIGSSSADDLSLVNNEESDFEFHFVSESFFSEGRLNALRVEPSSGTVPANSDITIRVTFTAKTTGKILFTLKCKVRGIQDPLNVTVEATTHIVQPLLAFEDLKKVKHYPDPNKETLLDFGTELVPNRPETIILNITSMSKPSFYYEWDYNKRILEMRFCKLKFTAKTGHVASFSRANCGVTIVFFKKSSLTHFPLKLKIRRGPTFTFKVNASAYTPLCEFSFSTYDFGYCFLQEKNLCFYETILIIKNKENSDLVLEAFLKEHSAFSYSLPTATIPSGDEINIYIQFHPKECVPYNDTIKFIINGIHERIVSLKGHGTDFKVTLLNPDDTTISFGAVRIGKTSTRHFTLINKSLAPATLLLGFSDQLPIHGLYLAKPKENLIDLSEKHRLTGIIKILPSTLFRIKPQEEYQVRVVYTPRYKGPPFSETVCLQFQEKAEPICILTGCSLGPEILLDRNFLNFGAVVQSCSKTMMVKLVNSGNIGARFEWNTGDLENYKIYPGSGYCAPESSVTIRVVFFPLTVQNCIKKSIECELFLSEYETYPSLFLNVVGDCIPLPEAEETIFFKCLVREKAQKTIEIENSTGNEWNLVPLVSGEYFKGFEALFVPPLSSATFEVNYCPLTMTEENTFHEGSVFFRLPTGNGLLYKLNGTSLPPNPEDVIVREVPCKTKYIELLKIRNWLQYPQRFRVNIARVDSQNDDAIICTGLETLEVPGLTEKEYSLNFFTYNMGFRKFLVNFVNEDTKEYVWYDITFNIVMCGPLEVITLKCGVRQTCHHEIKLENPLMKTIFYTLEATSPEIHFDRKLYEVPPEETVFAILSFTPIHHRETTEKLIAVCSELGTFPRELRLTSIEVKPEAPRVFQTTLGSSVTEEFQIQNLSHLNASLRSRTTSEDFTVNEQAVVGAGQTTTIKVTYEPSDMDSTIATLFVESEQAGNFTFPLLGLCSKPLAKGPFILKSGSGISIPFKNIFKKTKEFQIFVDNPGFWLKSTQEVIPPKEECKIYVGLQKTKHLEKLSENKDKGLDQRFPVMGQLVVECFNPYIKWQFYLKGILEK